MKRIYIPQRHYIIPTIKSTSDIAINTAGVVNEQAREIEKLQNEIKGLKEKLETQDKILEVEAFERIELKQEVNEMKEQMEKLKELLNSQTEQLPKYNEVIEIPPK
jgi:chromosome segregation ATPase